MADWMSKDSLTEINEISIENEKSIGDELFGFKQYTVIVNKKRQYNCKLSLFPFSIGMHKHHNGITLEIQLFKKLQFGISISLVGDSNE